MDEQGTHFLNEKKSPVGSKAYYDGSVNECTYMLLPVLVVGGTENEKNSSFHLFNFSSLISSFLQDK